MKRSKVRGRNAVARPPREIRVRNTAPRPAGTQPEVWVVKGRVIRFLDPSQPEETHAGTGRPGRLGGLWSALRSSRVRSAR
jgi:hypothetical protein